MLPLTALIAIALHGDGGRALAEATRAELARIHELMIGAEMADGAGPWRRPPAL